MERRKILLPPERLYQAQTSTYSKMVQISIHCTRVFCTSIVAFRTPFRCQHSSLIPGLQAILFSQCFRHFFSKDTSRNPSSTSFSSKYINAETLSRSTMFQVEGNDRHRNCYEIVLNTQDLVHFGCTTTQKHALFSVFFVDRHVLIVTPYLIAFPGCRGQAF